MTADVREEALSFDCEGEQLVGVLSMPGTRQADLALVVIVGGPQVRTGSHRQFTRLCRSVAAAGWPALRFDVRGMGDSSGPLHNFETVGADIEAAVQALQQRLPGIRRVVLWGLCDGASAALLYLHGRQAGANPDTRVAGLVLLNPWVRSAQTLARAHVKHYYWQRLRQREFWRKLLGGGVAMRAIRDLIANVRLAGSSRGGGTSPDQPVPPFQERMLLAATKFPHSMLWILSGRDYTAQEFKELAASDRRWQALMDASRVEQVSVAGADHTFSDRQDEASLFELTIAWMGRIGTRP